MKRGFPISHFPFPIQNKQGKWEMSFPTSPLPYNQTRMWSVMIISLLVVSERAQLIYFAFLQIKQDTEQLRVMYREGPHGTPFHTLLAEGFADGPIDVCEFEIQS